MTGRQLRPTDVKRLNRSWRRRTHGRLALLLESVTSPYNIGSIARSAAAFGVERIWLAGNATQPDHPKARKTALGSERFMEWHPEKKPAEAVDVVRANGFGVIAVELTSEAVPLHESALPPDLCLAIGNEDHGCSPALLAASDSAAYIPQVGRVASLNLAVAASLALSEARRQEWTRASRDGGYGT